MVAGSIPMKNSRNGTEVISSLHPPSVFLIRREKERHLARLHTPRSRGFVTGRAGLTPGRTLRLLVLARLIVRVLRCGGADWCGLVLGRVESWVRALGFPPFSLSPDPPDLLDASPVLITFYC